MSAPKTSEGTIPFSVPAAGKDCSTWYKTIGDIHNTSPPIKPLVVIHGGPGLSHDYLESMSELHDLYGIPIVFYDQIGNGRSTRLKETRGDESFWVEKLFIDELFNLIKSLGLDESGYDVLGHSWGGMMGSTFAGLRPKGMRKLVLSHAPADLAAWEKAYGEYRNAMPQEVQDTLKKHEDAGTIKDPEYEEALMLFFKKHMCTVSPFPEEFTRSFTYAEEDDTVSFTTNGPDEFVSSGSLTGWSGAASAKKIDVPTLVINGMNEGATDEAIKPFTEGIKGMKWVKFEKSTHMSIYEEKEKYFKVVGDFLTDK